ncbi:MULTISPECIES: AfsR/SARP family transcriptional regulator [Streptomyces]|uniref:BTAD domain-containing putative transcriptional regulator n=1 Tax=Streptomyces eurythermus TaxID=42237 RepID=A0ABW6Z512_9ACTN|nr:MULTISPECIES: AfsR/SARP family transcriptional regulator [Streptomyces]QIS74043.1 AfsR/SARP family transcriptional regulator [Streptomyces sp. DSM 40868]WDM16599.1 AfsR/SARP family transcriptional regulator [Streptomyces lavenduligriseus]
MPSVTTYSTGHPPDLLSPSPVTTLARTADAPEFRVLGTLEVRRGTAVYRPRGPKVRKLLALLVVRANDIVTMDQLVDELWEGAPPATAQNTARTHVYHLRQELGRQLGPDLVHALLVTESTGYSLRVDERQTDLTAFHGFYRQGCRQLRSGHVESAYESFGAALGLWRGTVLVDVRQGRVLTAHAREMEEFHLHAQEKRIEAAMRLGHYHELLPQLMNLVARHPYNEWLHAQLIDALHRAGRRGDALRAFQDVRTVLADELGVEPSADLRRVHQCVLMGERAA